MKLANLIAAIALSSSFAQAAEYDCFALKISLQDGKKVQSKASATIRVSGEEKKQLSKSRSGQLYAQIKSGYLMLGEATVLKSGAAKAAATSVKVGTPGANLTILESSRDLRDLYTTIVSCELVKK